MRNGILNMARLDVHILVECYMAKMPQLVVFFK